ncbi:MAG: hypothetical protein B7Z35_01170 [Hydrogenophilales bacterium 12-61-10]|nr:MAG: hypothetical protein B7Z35_01170 [Hydrogenophilales bacterium 12-61-10]OYX31237.1 MAG: hypothetical protein B7Z03_04545 [Hydrogenophilales bacterium 32-62-9]
MPDSDVFTFDGEGAEFKLRVACECYSDSALVREALTELPDLNGEIIWGSPRVPDPLKLIDADLVLIVSNRANLLTAIGRSVIYKHLEWAHVLIYLQDEADVPDVPTEAIPGLVLPRSQLAAGLLNLTKILIEPVITQGLVGIDWADVRTILAMGDQVVMEKASADQPETAIKAAVSQLQARASGRAIHGLQAAILCHGHKLAMRFIGDLHWACTDMAGMDTTMIVAAPLPDWPDIDYYEVRLFAKIECTGARWPSDLLLDFSD